MSPALGISRGDVGSELTKKSSLANLPGSRASRREQTSSCACSNSKTCKTHRHSAGNKEDTGSTLTARTGFCLLGLMRKKPLRWRGAGGGEQRNGSRWRGAGAERERERSTHTHAHTRTHDASEGSLVTSGSPAAVGQADCLPGSARGRLAALPELSILSSLLLRHKHIYSFTHTC